MNVLELYSQRNEFLAGAFIKLYNSKLTLRTPQLGGTPEILSDEFVNGWLLINYLYATEFGNNGKLYIGEIGGLVLGIPRSKDGFID